MHRYLCGRCLPLGVDYLLIEGGKYFGNLVNDPVLIFLLDTSFQAVNA